MRIGVNALFLIPGEVGGSETYLCETLRACAAQYPDDALVVFTHLENDAFLRNRFASFPQVTFVRFNFRASNRYARIIREQTELPARATRARLDVLWSPGYTAPVLTGVPQVLSILDMQYKRFPHDLTPLARWVTDALVRVGVRRCRRILTISAFSRDEIARFTAASVSKIDVTPLAVDAAFSEAIPYPERAALLGRLLPGVGPYLLCVANTYPHKNVDTLVRAYAALPSTLATHLVLVGKPRLGEEVVQAALRELPNPARVLRLGGMTRRELVALYQACEVFVFPSLYEGFGLPVLEAMAAGVPVVAANIPTTAEFGGEWVWSCDAHDAGDMARAIEAALREPPAARVARLQAAQRHALRFVWSETARRTHAALALASGLPTGAATSPD